MRPKHGNADGKEPTDLPSEDDRGSAGDRLMEFLDEMHAIMPDVPEEEAQKDIEEAIAAIRNQPIF